MDSFWLSLIVNVIAGALAGGITNQVAVWMLFHPYERRWGIQGAIPKSKERLAKSLGRVVGERLLTADDLLAELSRAGVREALDESISKFIADALETERPSLAELLPPATIESLQTALTEVADSVAGRLDVYVDSDTFTAAARSFVERAREEIGGKLVGDILSAGERDQFARSARKWAEDFSRSAELEGEVRDYIQKESSGILSRTAADLLLRALRSERAHEFLASTVRGLLENSADKTIGHMLRGVSDESIAEWIVAGARSGEGRIMARDALRRTAARAFTARIGKPAAWLPPDASERLAAALSPLIWEWVRRQLPRVVDQLDVESMVESRVRSFSIERLEEIIRGVTERELKLIVRLGYVLGAVIGLLTFAVSLAL